MLSALQTARPDERVAVHEILRETFAENKSVGWAVRWRGEHIDTLLDYSLGMAERFGAFYLDASRNTAVVYLLPNQKRPTWNELVASMRLLRATGLKRSLELLKRERYIHDLHPIDHDYIYLWFLGVRKSAQRQGLGSKALEQLKAFSDQRGWPIYLETSTERNLDFYGRAGFELYHTWTDGIMPFPLYHFRYPGD